LTPETGARYIHPLTDRYASREMQRIFAPIHRFGIWRRLWLALAETQRALGLSIPDIAIEGMRQALDKMDLGKAAEYERKFRHDVMAHVHLFGDDAPAARGIIHLGATSAFIGDNADLILHRDALTLVRARVVRTIRELAQFARANRSIPTLGYTHFQPAQPTTIGKRATLWIQDLLLDVEELDFRIGTLRFRGTKGTTGTQASFLELFNGDHAKVIALDREVAERMGFSQSYGVTGQTYPRKVDASIMGSLSGTAASLSKFGNDLRLLAHLREIEEPFEDTQIGSSAMPYKRNPMRAERICALARHVITLSMDPAMTAASQWLERTLDDSANRRLSIPDGFLTLDGALLLAENVASGLIVHPAVVRRNLQRDLPFIAMESVLMRAVEIGGGDRQDLHERIRRHAFAAAEKVKAGGENDLVERIAGDETFGLSERSLREMLEANSFVGRAPEQVDRFLEEWVHPVLARLATQADQLVGAPDVRV
jgi:adenylosuccinate lyase